MGRVEIGISKAKTAVLMLGALCFVIIGACLALFELPGGSPAWARVAGLICALFFGFCFVLYAKLLLNEKAGLVIDWRGIDDASSAFPIGFVPWEEVVEIREVEMGRQKLVAIVVKNPQAYVDSCPSLFSRLVMRSNIRLCQTPFCIVSNTLKCSYGELSAMLGESLKRCSS